MNCMLLFQVLTSSIFIDSNQFIYFRTLISRCESLEAFKIILEYTVKVLFENETEKFKQQSSLSNDDLISLTEPYELHTQSSYYEDSEENEEDSQNENNLI